MVEMTSSNVIPFTARDQTMTNALSEQSTSLLAMCRERLAQWVAAVFLQRLSQANDEFLNMADRALNLEQQQVYFAAMHFLAHRAQSLLQHFTSAYAAHFDASIAALTTPRSRSGLVAVDELSLIDTDDFEQDLAIGKLSTRAAFNCSQQLIPLDRRFAAVLNMQRISQDDNPLHPAHLFNAMLKALTGMDLDRQLALALLQSFERQTAAALPGIYAELNQSLANSGILPSIPQAANQPLSMPSVERASSAPGRMPGEAGQVPVVSEDLFSRLLQALQTANAPSLPLAAQSAQTGWQPQPPLASAYAAAPPATLGVNQLIHALTALQHGQTDPRALPGLGALRIDPAQANVLHQIRATPMAHGSHPLDTVTIDIVSMLFDAIFNDPDLSAAMRAEIAKLQIPVLKVALLDKGFFSDRKHPARRLLDAIAKSGIGRNEHDEPHLLAKIRAIVEQVINGFESDTQIFAAQVDKIETFLRDEEDRAHSKATSMVDQLERRERKEVAASRVGAEIEQRVTRPNLPPLIVDFLTQHWRTVLMETFVRAGESSADWIEAIRLMDELIWSVEPKFGATERDRLLVLLPDLLKRLRLGLEGVDLEGAWDDFFSELIRLHMAALQKETPAASHTPAAPRPAAPNTENTPVTSAPVLDTTPLADRHLRLVQALEPGAWIEFQSFRGTRNTLRLGWVSEFKRVYLFTNRQGENAMTLAATSLAEHLRKGSARLLSQNPLTERAVAQVLEQVTPASHD